MIYLKKLLALSLLFYLLCANTGTYAAVVADWGSVVTPITSKASFSFSQQNINNNFTNQYSFSLEGSTGATYQDSFEFAACKNGCGSPDLSYGIYDANVSLYNTTNGSLTFAAGNYMFQVKGTGMGSGNNLSYSGMVNFSTVAAGLLEADANISGEKDSVEPTPWGLLKVRQFEAKRQYRSEYVSYWLTIGDRHLLPGLERKLAQLRYGLSGEVPDGMLIRISSLDTDKSAEFSLQKNFIEEMLSSLDSTNREKLSGNISGY